MQHGNLNIILGPPGTGKTTKLIGLVEKHLAEIIVLSVIVLACSSCSTTHHAPGITEWNKQYSCR